MANGLKFKCQNPDCGLEGTTEHGPWKLQFTGGLEVLCPACQKISTFIGQMGQNVRFHRAKDEVAQALRDRGPVDEVGRGKTKPAGDTLIDAP